MVAALGLALVGTVQNGWFAQSMGATPVAGTLFLILGVASDAIALVLPSVAARAWQARQRSPALAGWLVWLATFSFALVSSIGFAATNIADVTMVRASRETPAVLKRPSVTRCYRAIWNAKPRPASSAGNARRKFKFSGLTWTPPHNRSGGRRTLRPWRPSNSSHGSPLVRSRRAKTTSACSGSCCLPAAATWRRLGHGRAHMKYTDDKAKVDAMREAHWQIKAAIDELKEGHPVPMALYRAARQLHFLLLDADAES